MRGAPNAGVVDCLFICFLERVRNSFKYASLASTVSSVFPYKLPKNLGRIAMLKQTALLACSLLFASAPAAAQPPAVQYDAELAKSLGADERGMKAYVLVILKTGPTRVPDGDARKKMFEGHFANITRLAAEKKLALAGPLDGVDGWRGLYVFATPDIEQAKTYVATDPVIINGEMIAEYHKFYGSAGMMMLHEIHSKISKK
jgi:uncharacterized protein YciI